MTTASKPGRAQRTGYPQPSLALFFKVVMVDTTSRVVLYSVVARITDARTVIWRKVSRTGASSEVVRISVFTQVFTAGSGGATRMKSTSGATAIVASSTSA